MGQDNPTYPLPAWYFQAPAILAQQQSPEAYLVGLFERHTEGWMGLDARVGSGALGGR